MARPFVQLYWYQLSVIMLEAAGNGDAVRYRQARDEMLHRTKPEASLRDALVAACERLLEQAGRDDYDDQSDVPAAQLVAQILGYTKPRGDGEAFRQELDRELVRLVRDYHPDRFARAGNEAKVHEMATRMAGLINEMRRMLGEEG